MQRFYISLLLTVILLGCSWAAADVLVIVTYNIHHGEGMDGKVDIDRIVNVIQPLNPHIVCLQEVDRNLPRTMHRDMPALFAKKLEMDVVFEPNFQFDGGEYGNATLTNLPILKHRNIALPNPISTEPRGCLVVTVKWQSKQIDIMNTHLGLNGQERLAQAEAIAKEIEERPVILAGDMNEHHTAPGMKVILKELNDTYIKSSDSIRGTIPVDKPVRRIDYILMSNAFQVVDSCIIHDDLTRLASDHLPYIVTMKMDTVE